MCQKYTSPMDGICIKKNINKSSRQVENSRAEKEPSETVLNYQIKKHIRKPVTEFEEETDTRCVTCEGRCSSLAQ